MDATAALRRGTKVLVSSFLLSAAAALVLGCDQADAQAESQKGPAAAAPETGAKVEGPDAGDKARVSTGQPSYKEDAFHLSLEGPPEVKTGEQVEFKVILSAQSGYKVNDEYPLKFQFEEMAKIQPAKSVVRKEDAKVEKLRAEMPLSVTVQAPGKHRVSGKLSFSVCTEERCLIEKRDLSIELTAS